METRQEGNGFPVEVRAPEPEIFAVALPPQPRTPTKVLEVIEHNILIPRAETTTTSSSGSGSTCPADSTDPICAKPVSSSTFTLPIILGVTIPVVGAIVAFLYLHRRHVRKVRLEDANDRHKSLDFGLDDVPRKPGAKGKLAGAGVTPLDLREKPGRRGRGMSLDVSSPYILPPELQESRESLHSMTRNFYQQEDPYRPVAEYQRASSRQSSRQSFRKEDGSSIYTKSSGAPSRLNDNANLLANASRMSRSDPPVGFMPPPRQNSLSQNNSSLSPTNPQPALLDSTPISPISPIEPAHLAPEPAAPYEIPRKASPLNPQAGLMPLPQAQQGEIVGQDNYNQLPNNNLPPYPQELDGMPDFNARRSPPVEKSLPPNPRPPQKDSLPVIESSQNDWFADVKDTDDFKVTPPSPGREFYNEQPNTQRYSFDGPSAGMNADAGLGVPGFNPQRLSMGLRPLPPDEVNEVDDPEVRANRIRSFYREYFDESKPAPQGGYYEDYDQNYLGDAAYFDPDHNTFVMPYAQPVTRRAMTPPPGQGRFRGPPPPRAFHGSMGGPMGGPMGPPMGGAGRFLPPVDRPFSSASNRRPGPGPRGPPRRPMPPPAALSTLPTPSKLKDDSFAIFNAADFAPPSSFKERARGRSQSPLGERRPYSPSVPAYKPLASSYDDLAEVPSPYLLRKSGTFTGLDFAPPRKFRGDGDTMSDAGSIRSNRSGVSALQSDAIRKGAYRVGRLPGDTVFSKDNLSEILKPTWEQRQKP